MLKFFYKEKNAAKNIGCTRLLLQNIFSTHLTL